MASESHAGDALALARSAWGAAARVEGLAPLAGDASSRRYFRVRLAAPAPPTAVLMAQSGSGLSISSDELSSIVDAPKEMPFLNVQRYLQRSGVLVPDVYAASSERGLALLEDVGDTTLWESAAPPADAPALYRAAVEGIIDLQLAGRGAPDASCIAFQQTFDERLFRWELDHFLEFGFGTRPPAAVDLARLREIFDDVAARLAAEPTELAHRDYHSWNLFLQDGRIRVIDFQDALGAPASYDLASLLTDRMTPTRVAAELESNLVDFYCRRWHERSGERRDRAAFRRLYFETALQRALKVVGRFHYLEEVKGKQGYVAMLPHTLATVRHCLAHLPALGELHSILARSFPELAE